ncbi:hypothetical protein LY78DRAFT_673367 [Colletotrichum sublineola]|nr:hypothetical protein LY78DRAFT_673367 [Colletotrichum sublineola]
MPFIWVMWAFKYSHTTSSAPRSPNRTTQQPRRPAYPRVSYLQCPASLLPRNVTYATIHTRLSLSLTLSPLSPIVKTSLPRLFLPNTTPTYSPSPTQTTYARRQSHASRRPRDMPEPLNYHLPSQLAILFILADAPVAPVAPSSPT